MRKHRASAADARGVKLLRPRVLSRTVHALRFLDADPPRYTHYEKNAVRIASSIAAPGTCLGGGLCERDVSKVDLVRSGGIQSGDGLTFAVGGS